MYPSGDLNQLAARKKVLQAKIALRRWECAVAAAELSRPIALVDRGLELWRQFAPLIKLLGVPAGFLLARKFGRRGGARGRRRSLIGTALKLLPLILRGAKMFMAVRTHLPSQGRTTRHRSAAREGRVSA